MYAPLGATFNQTRSEWTFKCGAKISLNTLQYESDIEDHLGSSWDFVGIDEAASFSLKNVLFFWSRCRSKSGVKPTLRMTANPDNSSFLFPLITWWLDGESGYPDYSKSGVIRHFVTEDEKLKWSDEPVYDSGIKISTSFTFIPSKLTDNTHLLQSDPSYYRRLMSLPTQERERFLEGSWLGSSGGDTEWPRDLFLGLFVPAAEFPDINHPGGCVRMFAVDPSKGRSTKQGDYSAIVCIAQTRDLKYIDADAARRSPGQIVEDLFLFCEQDHHKIRSGDLIGIEALQFQSIFIDLIMRYAADHPEYALSKYLRGGNIIIPVEDSLNKMMRIRRLDRPIRGREFRLIENPSTMMLLNQMKAFDGTAAVGKYDDLLDALDMAQQLPSHMTKYYENARKRQ